MTSPGLPLEVVHEMFLGGDWVALDADAGGTVRQNPAAQVERGAKDEQSRSAPGWCSFTLNDEAGDYDRRNPTGQWHGSLGKSSPLRSRVRLLDDNVPQTVSNGWGTSGYGNTWVTGAGSGGTVAATDWSRSGTVLRHSLPAAPGTRISDLSTTGWWDCEVRYRVQIPTSDIAGGLAATLLKFRELDGDNYVGVQVVFHTTDSVQVGVIDRIAGVNRRLLSDISMLPNGTIATDQTFRVAVLVEGPVVRAKAWVDGDPEPYDWQVSCARATERAGTFGLVSVLDTGNSNSKPFVFVYDQFEIGVPVFCGITSDLNPVMDDQSNSSRAMAVRAGDMLHLLDSPGAPPLKSAFTRTYSASTGLIRKATSPIKSRASVGDVNTITVLDADATGVAVGDVFRLRAPGAFINAPLKEETLFRVAAKASAFGFTNIDFTPDAMAPVEVGDQFIHYRAAVAGDMPVAYWPLEDDRGSTTAAAGMPGVAPMRMLFADAEFGASSDLAGTASVVRMNNAELVGVVPDYDDTNEAFRIDVLLALPESDDAGTGQDMLQWYTTGTGMSYDFRYTGSGTVDLLVFNRSGTQVFSDSWPAPDLVGGMVQFLIGVRQSGPSTVTAHVDYLAYEGNQQFASVTSGDFTVTGVTDLGKITKIRVNPNTGYQDLRVGQLAIIPADLDVVARIEMISAHFGEALASRAERVAAEDALPFTLIQGRVPGMRLGTQQQGSLLDEFRAAEENDLGLLRGGRGAMALEYVRRAALHNQDPVVEVDFSAGETLAMNPVDNDSLTRNDVTVSRADGSSRRHRVVDGPLSIASPQDGGVGPRPDSKTISSSRDGDLLWQAQWRTHLGTVDEDRYPLIELTPAGTGLPLERLLSLNVGSLIRVTNVASMRRYYPVDQIVVGLTVALEKFAPRFTANCVPASPYRVWRIEDVVRGRIGSSTSVLDTGVDHDDTSLSVEISGALWTTDAARFPLYVDIDGDEIEVTTITGTASPQTFTVVRGVNGAAKTHDAGARVRISPRDRSHIAM
jgi:hypothetical protein